ncbi:hypothetical protein GCM10009665_54290 [Kitasatospora nipponensis]|uniref:Uncharacterized protein n=1 Tax=Kitasatospora nipponensis TaxID=258049 RepID=A0ABN1WNJ3_9ACTN
MARRAGPRRAVLGGEVLGGEVLTGVVERLPVVIRNSVTKESSSPAQRTLPADPGRPARSSSGPQRFGIDRSAAGGPGGYPAAAASTDSAAAVRA